MAGEADPEPFVPSAHPYRWVVLGGLWLIYFCFALTVASMAPLVAPIKQELGLSNSAMGGIMGAWPLVYIASAVPCGALLDRIGPRRALFLATLVIAASGLLRSLATGHLTLFLAVALFGVGGPLCSVGAPKVISLWFAGKERGLGMGLYFTGQALGAISALSLTHGLVMPLTGQSWRMVLVIYAGLVLSAGLVWLAVNAHPSCRTLERESAAQPKPPALEIFAELARLPVMQTVLVMALCMFFFNHALNNWLPQILLTGGMNAVDAGYWSSIPTMVGLVGALLIPRLATPARRYLILLVLMLCAGGATLLIEGTAGPALATGLILQGIARSAMGPILMLVLMETREIGSQRMGSAGGMFFSVGEIGGFLGPLTIGYVSDVAGGFGTGLYLLTGVCLLLILLLARLRLLSR